MTKTTAQEPASKDASTAETKAAQISPDQKTEELLFHIKGAIDRNGRYSDRLTDMSMGLAAGQGISAMAARAKLEQDFATKFGQKPHEYLDRHYEELRSAGRDTQLRPAASAAMNR